MSRFHVVLAAFLFATTAAPVAVFAQDPGASPAAPAPGGEEEGGGGFGHGGHGGHGGHKGGRHGGGGGEMWKNMSPECKAKMKALHEEAKTRRDKIEAEVKDPAEQKKQLQALHEEIKGRREAIMKECGGGAPGAGAPPSAAPSAAPSPAPAGQ